MNYFIDIQNVELLPARESDSSPSSSDPLAANAEAIVQIVEHTLATLQIAEAELTVRFSDISEVQALNREYRGKDRPTNVLSFPFADTLPEGVELDVPLLGDIVICVPVVADEAHAQNKSFTQHLTHLVVHGTLHLLGYDHINDDEAEVMEALEIQLLGELGLPNPYVHQHLPDSRSE
ncbi:rRNA maturation RNase YbeY [Aliidiomarina sanyensis]|uniref:rRNA maturation RNase YbeY n=1 Tax=Aliidiomarina sanyensis TaxID=1249555 RepID=UPI001F53F8EB|nr:rRNA maturation RNase YbeY [Aliidiomarina sanyensis]